ncbi:hypothetical protein NMY22_g15562 [Coprinellus aureogranulatus]|nr:hypothetical protein NMY22_g15562 [Coprinellus aureogranulatus]
MFVQSLQWQMPHTRLARVTSTRLWERGNAALGGTSLHRYPYLPHSTHLRDPSLIDYDSNMLLGVDLTFASFFSMPRWAPHTSLDNYPHPLPHCSSSPPPSLTPRHVKRSNTEQQSAPAPPSNMPPFCRLAVDYGDPAPQSPMRRMTLLFPLFVTVIAANTTPLHLDPLLRTRLCYPDTYATRLQRGLAVLAPPRGNQHPSHRNQACVVVANAVTLLAVPPNPTTLCPSSRNQHTELCIL